MFYSIADNYKCEKIVKKSIFITKLFYVDNVSFALDLIKKESDVKASHNCYAYIIENNKREEVACSDDGEPSGTAGYPMLSLLKQRNVKNILAITTRYFGGIKLGASKLLLQYKNCLKDALDEVMLIQMVRGVYLKLTIPFSAMKNYNCLKNKYMFNEIKIAFSDFVNIEIKIKLSDYEKFKNEVMVLLCPINILILEENVLIKS